MEGLIQLGIVIALLLLGYFAGSYNEKKHFQSIREREKNDLNRPVVNFEYFPPGREILNSQVVTGSTVVSVDYFKKFVASLKMLFGGDLDTYESLLDRARREAILRMRFEAGDADLIMNVRIETSSIHKGSGERQSVGAIEVLAYGTAVTYQV